MAQYVLTDFKELVVLVPGADSGFGPGNRRGSLPAPRIHHLCNLPGIPGYRKLSR
jgi:hypothetical protein